MTRINAAIKPQNLIDQHLLAEHREIKRIATAFAKKKKPFKIIHEFKLGTGHVNFFLDKGKYTLDRYKEIYNECIVRKFNVQDYSENWNCYQDYVDTFYKSWEPSEYDKKIIIERISERIKKSTQIPRYFGSSITKEKAVSLLNN